jgi:hypothetical protein
MTEETRTMTSLVSDPPLFSIADLFSPKVPFHFDLDRYTRPTAKRFIDNTKGLFVNMEDKILKMILIYLPAGSVN